MIRQRISTRRSRRRGFSLAEMIVAFTLASMLGILLAQACATFGRTALEVEARARIALKGEPGHPIARLRFGRVPGRRSGSNRNQKPVSIHLVEPTPGVSSRQFVVAQLPGPELGKPCHHV